METDVDAAVSSEMEDEGYANFGWTKMDNSLPVI